ncbi:MAG: four helix bundle protein [Prolixibacteraceae bacterium]|jgi:four helix bundle protein|nr:four helix bundle protein [Prolixibacteraceae bacterium]
MHRYKELKVWQKSRELVKEIYLTTDGFPKAEIYGITSQIRRSAVSIPANIAEGCGRNTNKELNRFMDIAQGSAFELETLILLCGDLNYIDENRSKYLLSTLVEIHKMVFSFKKQLPKS